MLGRQAGHTHNPTLKSQKQGGYCYFGASLSNRVRPCLKKEGGKRKEGKKKGGRGRYWERMSIISRQFTYSTNLKINHH